MSVNNYFPYLPIVTNPENNPCMQIADGDPDRHQNLNIVHWPIGNLPKTFMQIPSDVFVQSC